MSTEDPGSTPWTTPGGSLPPPSGWPPQPQPGGWVQPPYYGGSWPTMRPQAPRPGVIPLRPLGVGELLDGAFTTIRRYPGATLGLAASVMFVVEVVRVLATYYFLHGINLTNTNGDYIARTQTVSVAVGLVSLVATSLLSGMIAAVVGQGVIGRPMSPAAAWTSARQAIWRLLGASLLIPLITGLVIFCGALPGILVVILGPNLLGVALLVIGSFFAVLAGVYVFCVLSFTAPAIVLERIGVIHAMSRSRILVRGSWWRVFGILVLTAIITSILSGIIEIPFVVAGGYHTLFSTDSNQEFTFVSVLLTGIGTLIATTLVQPFSTSVTALLYLDRRMRAEALDLTLQQAAANPPR